MKKINLLSLLLLSCMLLSCEKIKSPKESSITICIYDDMIINTYNTKISRGSNETVYLDVNNDGIEDVFFEARVTYSQMAGEEYFSNVKNVNRDLAFCGLRDNDTIFLHIDTLNRQVEDHTIVHYINSCRRIDDADLIKSTRESFNLRFFDTDDQVNLRDEFEPVTAGLLGQEYFLAGSNCSSEYGDNYHCSLYYYQMSFHETN